MIFQPAHYRGSYEPSDPFHFTLHHNRFALTLLPATSSPKYMLDGMGGNPLLTHTSGVYGRGG